VTATYRAAECSLAILEKLSHYVAGDVRLTLHIGMGAGDLISLHVGGVNEYWEYLVAGQPLGQMALAEVQAKSGEACISPEGWALIQNYYEGTPLESGVVRLNEVKNKSKDLFGSDFPAGFENLLIPPQFSNPNSPILRSEIVKILRGYISPDIRVRLEAGQSHWLSELRRVTVLFVGLPPVKDMTPAALKQIQSCVHTLESVLFQYEGTLRNVMMDDKGLVAIAAFDLPPISHEDDTVRGVQAALAIQNQLQKFGFNAKIGITTGRVYCGTVGSECRREYTVLGDVVNLPPGVSDLDNLNLPGTVQGVITSRIDRLSPSLQLTLKVASAIGRAFDFEILQEIHPIEADKEQLTDYLKQLAVFDLTPLVTPEPELAYIFKHIITQEVSYNLMLFAQRRSLHQLVAEWYEQHYGQEISEYYEIIAYHYEHAEICEKALEYMMKAGKKAQQTYVHPEALSHYNRALTICKYLGDAVDSNTLITIYAALGQVHFLLSDFQPSIDAYKKMLEVACREGDRHKEAEALYNIGYGWFWAHDFESALEYAQQAYNLALEIDYKSMLAASQFVMGYIYGMTAKLDESFGCFSEGISLSQETGDNIQEGLNTFMLGLVYNWKGEYEPAHQLGSRGVAIGRDDNILLVWIVNLWERGITRCGQGAYQGAFSDLETALNFSDR
jgi:tetratricopeptide (TPR) repeat protein/class 3 adenylate cyclase